MWFSGVELERSKIAKDVHPKVQTFLGHLFASRPNEILAKDYTSLEPALNGLENGLIVTDVFNKYTVATLGSCDLLV